MPFAMVLDHVPERLGAGTAEHQGDPHDHVAITTSGSSVIGKITFTLEGSTVLHVGHERPGTGDWIETERVVLTPGEREALLEDLLKHRTRCGQRVAKGVNCHLPIFPIKLTDTETVLARYLGADEQPEHRAAAAYAAGIVSGRVAPVTDWLQYESLAAALGSPAEYTTMLSTDEGWTPEAGPRGVSRDRSAVIGYQAWRKGIGLIHGLVDGLVADPRTGETHGEDTPLGVRLDLPGDLFTGTGLTLAGFAAAFADDFPAAATAFLRVTRSRGRTCMAGR
ncbi:hypothetical protein [Amycolatopsis anabasis]|uniref:hypothetical protein n=1 Tax=Amycolatopsis anabasis TaxID=1840409 RepID=UPI00131E7B46|nr:hypothetical protein [Amycolatopsis anabasis]